jgi:hypothetical protein
MIAFNNRFIFIIPNYSSTTMNKEGASSGLTNLAQQPLAMIFYEVTWDVFTENQLMQHPFSMSLI